MTFEPGRPTSRTSVEGSFRPDKRSDDRRQPLRRVDVGRVDEIALEEHHGRLVGGGVPDRPFRPGVSVGDHSHVGQPRPDRVKVAGDHHALYLCRHRSLEPAPIAAVEPHLIQGEAAPVGTSPLRGRSP